MALLHIYAATPYHLQFVSIVLTFYSARGKTTYQILFNAHE